MGKFELWTGFEHMFIRLAYIHASHCATRCPEKKGRGCEHCTDHTYCMWLNSLLEISQYPPHSWKHPDTHPVSDFWQSSSCSSRWGSSCIRVSSPTQHWTTFGVSWARVMIFTHDLSMLLKRLASWKVTTLPLSNLQTQKTYNNILPCTCLCICLQTQYCLHCLQTQYCLHCLQRPKATLSHLNMYWANSHIVL